MILLCTSHSCVALPHLRLSFHAHINRSHVADTKLLNVDRFEVDTSLPRATRLLLASMAAFCTSSELRLNLWIPEEMAKIQAKLDLDGLHQGKGGVVLNWQKIAVFPRSGSRSKQKEGC